MLFHILRVFVRNRGSKEGKKEKTYQKTRKHNAKPCVSLRPQAHFTIFQDFQGRPEKILDFLIKLQIPALAFGANSTSFFFLIFMFFSGRHEEKKDKTYKKTRTHLAKPCVSPRPQAHFCLFHDFSRISGKFKNSQGAAGRLPFSLWSKEYMVFLIQFLGEG